MTLQGEGGTRRTIEHAHAMIKRDAAARQRVRAASRSRSARSAWRCSAAARTAIPASPPTRRSATAPTCWCATAAPPSCRETPEIYGAEHLLTRRAVSQEVADKLIERIHWWEEYCERNGGEMNNNPSPGNKAGGLTTILEKSLGAAAKGGTTNLAGVYKYAEPITQKGFVYMDSPGYDPASATGQVASGGNIIAFTTGRGSCFGFKPTPSLKIATNTAMYRRMEEDMDINAGTILDGEETIEQVGERIFDLVVRGGRRRAVQVRGAGHGRQRVRALADRRGDVGQRQGGTQASAFRPSGSCSFASPRLLRSRLGAASARLPTETTANQQHRPIHDEAPTRFSRGRGGAPYGRPAARRRLGSAAT